MASETKPATPSGIPVDGSGDATVDPTKNVLDLVEAAIRRVDDLRDAESKRVDEKIDSEKIHSREIMELRAGHYKELRAAEAKRIDAIRAVDVGQVSATNERATSQAAVLAAQVASTAETLRNLVATTANATATQLDVLTKLLTDRIAALEKTQYEGAGKERVTDPMMTQMLTEMKAMREFQKEGTGRGVGLNQGWIYLLGVLSLIGMILGIVSFFR